MRQIEYVIKQYEERNKIQEQLRRMKLITGLANNEDPKCHQVTLASEYSAAVIVHDEELITKLITVVNEHLQAQYKRLEDELNEVDRDLAAIWDANKGEPSHD